MGKNKPKGSKKSKVTLDLLNSATDGLRKFRRFTKQVSKLSTTQKVVGGLAVLAAGYALITKASPPEADSQTPAVDEHTPPAALSNPAPPTRAPKPKRAKPAGSSHHVPFSQEHS